MTRLLFALVLVSFVSPLGSAAADDHHATPLTCRFDGVAYLHRWTENDQHEFTPAGQEDLDHWTDMLTINLHRTAKDGDGLANVANAVLENYKRAGGRVIRTDSKPRTADEPAEHFVAVIFARPTSIEVAFARFKLVDGIGCVFVRSHREYGGKIGDRVSAWLQENGPKLEKELMRWNDFPKPAALKGSATGT